MRQPLIAGNWKMNGSQQMAASLISLLVESAPQLSNIEFSIFPPSVYLLEVASRLANTSIRWGAQTVSARPDGALTGEISVEMLKDIGCHYVILGHSERRANFNESDALIADKAKAVVEGGLVPIVCIGETLQQREAGQTLAIIEEQLAHVLGLKDNLPAVTSIIFAYEPIWAIGTGQTATPEQADEVHHFVRQACEATVSGWGESVRILYGGSVNPTNAAALFAMPNIDGALVGGASLKADQFIEIGRQWNKS